MLNLAAARNTSGSLDYPVKAGTDVALTASIKLMEIKVEFSVEKADQQSAER